LQQLISGKTYYLRSAGHWLQRYDLHEYRLPVYVQVNSKELWVDFIEIKRIGRLWTRRAGVAEMRICTLPNAI